MAERQEIIEWHEGDGGSLGRNIQHDARSLAYPFSEDLVTTIVTKRHNRYGPILDQDVDITYKGQVYHGTGSCTGNAADGNLGTEPFTPTVPTKESTALDIYSAATQIDGFGSPWPTNDRGSSGLAVAKVCQKNGWLSGYQHVFSLTSMLKALQVTPVIVGTNWYGQMDNPVNGVINDFTGGDLRGGHEYEAIGVDVENKQIEFVNSWGGSWGQGGHFFMSYALVERLLGEQGDVTVFVPLSQPAPTPVPPTPPTPTPTPPSPQPTPTPTPSDVDQAMWNAIKKFFDEAKHWAEGKGWQ